MTATQIQTPHYRKTKDGKWVVAGPSSIIQEGATVTVRKRDGSSKTEHIESVGREYDDHGVKCRYGYPSARTSSYSRRSRFEDDESCELCGQNRYTCGHCIGW